MSVRQLPFRSCQASALHVGQRHPAGTTTTQRAHGGQVPAGQMCTSSVPVYEAITVSGNSLPRSVRLRAGAAQASRARSRQLAAVHAPDRVAAAVHADGQDPAQLAE